MIITTIFEGKRSSPTFETKRDPYAFGLGKLFLFTTCMTLNKEKNFNLQVIIPSLQTQHLISSN